LGRLALSQPLSSARNASSSALNLKSIDSSGGTRAMAHSWLRPR
jgi:hypothetical protein